MMINKTWSPIPKFYDVLMAGSIDGTDTEPHDHGIIRAMTAKYKPNSMVSGDSYATVFVSKLSHRTDEDTLHQIFSKFGEIKQLRLVRDIVTGFSRGYAFIEFSSEREAYRAMREGHKLIVNDKEIFADFECERTLRGWIPRRLGGGFGGNKESGQLRFGGKSRPFKEPILVSKDEQRATSRLYISDDKRGRDISQDQRQSHTDRWGDNERGRYSERKDRDYERRDRKYKDSERDRDYKEHGRRRQYSRSRSRSQSRSRSYRSSYRDKRR